MSLFFLFSFKKILPKSRNWDNKKIFKSFARSKGPLLDQCLIRPREKAPPGDCTWRSETFSNRSSTVSEKGLLRYKDRVVAIKNRSVAMAWSNVQASLLDSSLGTRRSYDIIIPPWNKILHPLFTIVHSNYHQTRRNENQNNCNALYTLVIKLFAA